MTLELQTAERLKLAVQIAREAGKLTLQYFRSASLEVETKTDSSPVTVADRQAEELLRDRISAEFSNDAILGEEFGSRDGTSGFQWVLDPIDGTKSFVHGVPLYTNLIAVLYDNEPLIGVINAPATAEMVYARRGGGCWHTKGDGTLPIRAQVSKVQTLAESLLLTSEMEGFKRHQRVDAMDAFLRLQAAARIGRTWGDGYGYLMVATGRAEVMIDPIMNLWDAAPLQTVLEEAGGSFTDWAGKATIHSGEAIATNGLVTEEVLRFIEEL